MLSARLIVAANGLEAGYYTRRITIAQREYLAQVCSGREVVDLGGGGGLLCRFLLETGCKGALNIEKERLTFQEHHEKLTHFCGYFADFASDPKRVEAQRGKLFILCWPLNNRYFSRGAVELIGVAGEIIYIGLNNMDSACGTDLLWRHLSTRKILRSDDDPTCRLIHYVNTEVQRELLLEEAVGLTVTG